MLSEERRMEILEAYDLTKSYRAAAALVGCDHHIVKRYVGARAAGLDPTSAIGRPKLADAFVDKIAEWIDRSAGRVRADVVHRKLVAMGYPGSERTTRRVVAVLKRDHLRASHRIYRPWIPEPGLWLHGNGGDAVVAATVTGTYCRPGSKASALSPPRRTRRRSDRAGFSARRHGIRRSLLLLVAVIGVSCSSEAATPKPKTPRETTTVLLPDRGTLYLGAGPTLSSEDLYRIRGDGRSRAERVTALPPGRNLSVLTAGSGQLIVSEASEGTDKIARVVGNRLERLIDDRVFTPSLSDDGRLAYVRLDEAVGRPNEHFVVVRDLASGEERTVYQHRGGSLSYPAWGPTSLLAVVEKDGPTFRQARIVLIGADGTVRKVELGDRTSTALLGSQRAAQLVVVDYGPPPTAFLLDPGSGRRDPLPPGWLPLTWSPDGSSLLVANGRRLGLIRRPELVRVNEIGASPEPVWQADWVDAEAEPETPSPDGTQSRTPTKETP